MTRRSLLSDSLSLTVASFVNGAAAYAFAVAGTRYLGPEGFSDVSVAWSFWALTVAAITLPIQHWMTWRGELDRGLSGIIAARGRMLVAGVVASGVLGLIALEPRFFSDGWVWAALVTGLGVGAWLLGWGRGMLAAQGDYRGVAIIIGGENVVRLVALALVFAFGGGSLLVGCALLSGPLVLVPFFGRLLPSVRPVATRIKLIRSLAALGGAMAIAQSVLHLGPAAAAWLDLSDTVVTATFSTFALARAPVLVLLALSSRVTAPVTRLIADGNHRTLLKLAEWSLAATLILAAAAGALMYAIGPALVEAFFGTGTALSSWETGVVAAGMVLASYALLQLLLFLSSERPAPGAAIWAASSAIGILVLNLAPEGAVAVAFSAVELAAVLTGAFVHSAWLRSRVVARTR